MIFKKKQLEWALEVWFFSTFVIFVFHGPWIMHWGIWKILIVKAKSPSIFVRFSKSWWLNTSAFQELSFDVQNTHVARAHVPRNVSLSGSMKIKNHKSWKKMTFQCPFQLFFFKNHLSISYRKIQKIEKKFGTKTKKVIRAHPWNL